MTISGYPDQVPREYLIEPSVFDSDEPFPRFMNVAGTLGLNTFHGTIRKGIWYKLCFLTHFFSNSLRRPVNGYAILFQSAVPT